MGEKKVNQLKNTKKEKDTEIEEKIESVKSPKEKTSKAFKPFSFFIKLSENERFLKVTGLSFLLISSYLLIAFTSFLFGRDWVTASFWQDWYGIIPLFVVLAHTRPRKLITPF